MKQESVASSFEPWKFQDRMYSAAIGETIKYLEVVREGHPDVPRVEDKKQDRRHMQYKAQKTIGFMSMVMSVS